VERASRHTGDGDTTVSPAGSESFHQRLKQVGARSTLTIYPVAERVGILLDALAGGGSRHMDDLAACARRCPLG
jgi:hypothetical protein